MNMPTIAPPRANSASTIKQSASNMTKNSCANLDFDLLDLFSPKGSAMQVETNFIEPLATVPIQTYFIEALASVPIQTYFNEPITNLVESNFTSINVPTNADSSPSDVNVSHYTVKPPNPNVEGQSSSCNSIDISLEEAFKLLDMDHLR